MHPIDLSCHQKFEKVPLAESRNINAKLEIWKKSGSTRSHFTNARSCSHAQSSFHACETNSVLSGCVLSERDFPFDCLQVSRKVTKISWGEFYRSHLH